MAVYEYQCAKYGIFDHEQRITSPKLTECPICQRCEPKRLISGAPAFHLVAGPSGGWSSQSYSKTETERRAEAKLGRKVVRRTY
jgi:putative FmdB family regulatory protein